MMPAQSIPRLLFCAALLAAATLSHAEKADRSKPVNLEADRVTVDDVNKVHLFDGNVTLSQGTLSIRGDKLVVKQDAEGFQNGIATANPEVTKLFNRAYVKSGQDEVRGQYIVIDGQKETYSVTSGPSGAVVPGRDNRVRAVIQPKNKPAGPETAAPGQPVRLQMAPGISNPRQE